jgi:hypothetical protein
VGLACNPVSSLQPLSRVEASLGESSLLLAPWALLAAYLSIPGEREAVGGLHERSQGGLHAVQGCHAVAIRTGNTITDSLGFHVRSELPLDPSNPLVQEVMESLNPF